MDTLKRLQSLPNSWRLAATQPSPRQRDLYAAFLRERLYGTLTLMGVSIGLLLSPETTLGHAVGSIVGTGAGLWLASFFATVIAHRAVHDQPLTRRQIWHEFAVHWGLVGAMAIPLILLCMAWAGWIDVRTALMVDVVLAVSFTLSAILRAAKTRQDNLRTSIVLGGIQFVLAALVIAAKTKL